jgi:hypothetical protein
MLEMRPPPSERRITAPVLASSVTVERTLVTLVLLLMFDGIV